MYESGKTNKEEVTKEIGEERSSTKIVVDVVVQRLQNLYKGFTQGDLKISIN